MGEVPLKRPNGLTLIAIVWFIFGILNVYFSFQKINVDLRMWSSLSDSVVHEWFSFWVPAQWVLAILGLCLGLLQIITVLGLWTGKPYSYKLALIVTVLLVIGPISSAGLYASAPAELDMGFNVGTFIFPVVMSIVWIVIYWRYLRRPHVKAFLGITQPQITLQEEPTATKEKTMVVKEEKTSEKEPKFYCRYCGVENKSDAVFCEKCGKQLKET